MKILKSHIDGGSQLILFDQELKQEKQAVKELTQQIQQMTNEFERSIAGSQQQFNSLEEKNKTFNLKNNSLENDLQSMQQKMNEMIKFSKIEAVTRGDVMLFVKFSYQNYLMAITHVENTPVYLIAPFNVSSPQRDALIYCARVVNDVRPLTTNDTADANILSSLKFDRNDRVFIVNVSDVTGVNVDYIPQGKFDDKSLKAPIFEDYHKIQANPNQIALNNQFTFNRVPEDNGSAHHNQNAFQFIEPQVDRGRVPTGVFGNGEQARPEIQNLAQTRDKPVIKIKSQAQPTNQIMIEDPQHYQQQQQPQIQQIQMTGANGQQPKKIKFVSK